MESSWNSHTLQVTYTVFGWIALSSWSLSFYPQVILNFFKKSIVGLNFNYVVLNNTKHTLYLIYNASMYFSPVVQMQYRENMALTRDSVSGGEMASWNSIPLQITYEILGWTSFLSWSVSFYPQVILNFRRKSVVGLNLDFVLLNLTKHSSYLIYNVCLYFSPAIQKQYFEKYGYGQMIPVAANDVAFSIHAVLLTAVTLFQIAIYDRGTQKVSKIAIGIVSAVWLSAAVCVFVALPSHSWLWLISIFNSIQVFMTVIKYIPQAVMNFMRKSTDGFSIGNILLDFLGGVTNYTQMAVQSIDQNSWVNFYGNIGKTMLSLVSIFFDILFMCQHFVLYPATKRLISPKVEKEGVEPLIKSSDHSESENV